MNHQTHTTHTCVALARDEERVGRVLGVALEPEAEEDLRVARRRCVVGHVVRAVARAAEADACGVTSGSRQDPSECTYPWVDTHHACMTRDRIKKKKKTTLTMGSGTWVAPRCADLLLFSALQRQCVSALFFAVDRSISDLFDRPRG